MPEKSTVLVLNEVLMLLAVVHPSKELEKGHLQDAKDQIVLAISRLNPGFLSPFDWKYLARRASECAPAGYNAYMEQESANAQKQAGVKE